MSTDEIEHDYDGYLVAKDEVHLMLLMKGENTDDADWAEDRAQTSPAQEITITQSPIGGYMWMAKWASNLVRAAGPCVTRNDAALEVRKHVRISSATFVRVEGRASSEVRFLEIPKPGPRAGATAEG